MIVDLEKLPEGGARFVGEDSEEILELRQDNNWSAAGAVKYDLRILFVSNELIVSGRLGTDVETRCSRCAESCRMEISENDFRCNKEIGPEELSVDLTPEIREAIILAFPSYPICSNDCKGLCSQCGEKLNEKKCDCRPPPDHRWNVLNNLEPD